MFKKAPLHNWASHGADAWRYLSLQLKDRMPSVEKPFKSTELTYEGRPDGTIVANMSVWQIVQQRMKRKMGEDDWVDRAVTL